MRNRIIVFLTIMFLPFNSFLFTQEQEKPSKDCFVLEPGTRLEYKIEVGLADVVDQRKLTSFSSRQEPRFIERNLTSIGIILNREAENTGGVKLILMVGDSSICNSPWGRYEGMEVVIERDDLGFYKYHQRVFWAIIEGEDYFCIREIVEYGSEMHNLRGARGWFGRSEQLYSTRIIFHTGAPNMVIKAENDPIDVLKFSGQVGDECFFERHYCLNRTQTQGRSDFRNNGYRNNNQFEEQATPVIWEKLKFKGGKLTSLEQMIGNDISMIWTLQEN